MTTVDKHADKFHYRVIWSQEDSEFVGLCEEFPSLSWLAPTQEEALKGIRDVVRDAVKDKEASGEKISQMFATLEKYKMRAVAVYLETRERLHNDDLVIFIDENEGKILVYQRSELLTNPSCPASLRAKVQQDPRKLRGAALGFWLYVFLNEAEASADASGFSVPVTLIDPLVAPIMPSDPSQWN